MYVPPTFRAIPEQEEICNICDEFLHIDETPEANICMCCAENRMCIRKSVTCIGILTNEEGEEVYSRLYKNKKVQHGDAIHAEMFLIHDLHLRHSLAKKQTLTLYLTYQPCHFSGGHFKMKHKSCTEALIQFYEKVLQSFQIRMVIKFAYVYRAHWVSVSCKYDDMIHNAIEGIRLLAKYADLDIIDQNDLPILYRFCNTAMKQKCDAGDFAYLISKRNEVEQFFKMFLQKLIAC